MKISRLHRRNLLALAAAAALTARIVAQKIAGPLGGNVVIARAKIRRQ